MEKQIKEVSMAKSTCIPLEGIVRARDSHESLTILFQLTTSTNPFKISANVSAVTRARPTTEGSRVMQRSHAVHAPASAGARFSDAQWLAW